MKLLPMLTNGLLYLYVLVPLEKGWMDTPDFGSCGYYGLTVL